MRSIGIKQAQKCSGTDAKTDFKHINHPRTNRYYRDYCFSKGEEGIAMALISYKNTPLSQCIFTIKPAAFESVFGNGVKLKNKYITIVDEPVSFGKVENALSWIGKRPMGIGKVDPKRPDQAKYIAINSFIQKGIRK